MEEQTKQQPAVKKSKGLLWKLIMAVAAVAVVVLIVVVQGRANAPAADPSDQPQTGTLADTEGRFQTPVGELTFPIEWADQVTLQANQDDGAYTGAFYGKVGTQQVLLFRLLIGGQGTGYELGSAPNGQNQLQSVWLDISQIEADPAWTEEQTKEINTVQACVNDLIDQINELPGFQGLD